MWLDCPRARVTVFLIAVSVGRWFIIFPGGCALSHRFSSIWSWARYASSCACVDVVGGLGRCGLIGVVSRMGLLELSLIGVLVSTSIISSSAAR